MQLLVSCFFPGFCAYFTKIWNTQRIHCTQSKWWASEGDLLPLVHCCHTQHEPLSIRHKHSGNIVCSLHPFLYTSVNGRVVKWGSVSLWTAGSRISTEVSLVTKLLSLELYSTFPFALCKGEGTGFGLTVGTHLGGWATWSNSGRSAVEPRREDVSGWETLLQNNISSHQTNDSADIYGNFKTRVRRQWSATFISFLRYHGHKQGTTVRPQRPVNARLQVNGWDKLENIPSRFSRDIVFTRMGRMKGQTTPNTGEGASVNLKEVIKIPACSTIWQLKH